MDDAPTPSFPAALSRDPFLLGLARRLLTKAERSTASAPIRLALDRKAASELYDAVDDEKVQLLRMQLHDLCATGWVVLHLDPPRTFASFTDRKPRLELCNFDALATWADYVPLAQRWQWQWRLHLAAQWANHPEAAPADSIATLDYLARNPLAQMEGLSLEEATDSLSTLIGLCRAGRVLALREASAQAFQGRSKLLDHREELLRLLGAAPGQFTEPPIQLLLAPPVPASVGGSAFKDVLFVENLTTFEHMADVRAPAWMDSLLIYAAGFRGSARRLRTRPGCRLYLRAFAPATSLLAIEDWLFDEQPESGDTGQQAPVHFFGDLDYAGMQILASLREVFPQAGAWRPGYDYLASGLAAGGGHRPEQAAKTQQVDPERTGCDYADRELLPLLRERGRFMDQEAFVPG
ncbi:hypothetical protein ISP14_02955 [Dyella agri]|uniref:Wadjet protein JetD C-terminal domain-containing protein n=2 Tax=Dyella agri TaxID=1926869 RepID=A0ABW8KGA0_9GAMM